MPEERAGMVATGWPPLDEPKPFLENDATKIYTDGSYGQSYRRKTCHAGWGFIAFHQSSEILEEYAVEKRCGYVYTSRNSKRQDAPHGEATHELLEDHTEVLPTAPEARSVDVQGEVSVNHPRCIVPTLA